MSWVVFCDPAVAAIPVPRDGPPASIPLLRQFFLAELAGVGERNLEVSEREATMMMVNAPGCFVEYVFSAFVRGTLTSAEILTSLEGSAANGLAIEFAEPLGIKNVAVSQQPAPSPFLPPSPPSPPSPPPATEKLVTFDVRCSDNNGNDDDDSEEGEHAVELSIEGLKAAVKDEMPDEISSRDIFVTREPKNHKEEDPCSDFVYHVEVFTSRSPDSPPYQLTREVEEIAEDDDFEEYLDFKFIGKIKVRNVEKEIRLVPLPSAPPSPPPSPPSPPPPLEDVLTFVIACAPSMSESDDGSDGRRRLNRALNEDGVKDYVDETLDGAVSPRDTQVTRSRGGKGRRLSEEDPCDFEYFVEVFPTRSGADTDAIFAILDGDQFKEDTMTAFDGVTTVASDVVRFQAPVPAPFSPPPSPPSPPPVPPGSIVLDRVVVEATFDCVPPPGCGLALKTDVAAYHDEQLGPGLNPPRSLCPIVGLDGTAFLVTEVPLDSTIDPLALFVADSKEGQGNLADVVASDIGCPVELAVTRGEIVRTRLFCSVIDAGGVLTDVRSLDPPRWCGEGGEDGRNNNKAKCEAAYATTFVGPVATKLNRCRFRENVDEPTKCVLSGTARNIDDVVWCRNEQPPECAELDTMTDVTKLDPPEWCNTDPARRMDPDLCNSAFATTFAGISNAGDPWEKRHRCQHVPATGTQPAMCILGEPFAAFITNCLLI